MRIRPHGGAVADAIPSLCGTNFAMFFVAACAVSAGDADTFYQNFCPACLHHGHTATPRRTKPDRTPHPTHPAHLCRFVLPTPKVMQTALHSGTFFGWAECAFGERLSMSASLRSCGRQETGNRHSRRSEAVVTFELSGRSRRGAWAARPMISMTASRPKCLAGGGPLERRVRPHTRCRLLKARHLAWTEGRASLAAVVSDRARHSRRELAPFLCCG